MPTRNLVILYSDYRFLMDFFTAKCKEHATWHTNMSYAEASEVWSVIEEEIGLTIKLPPKKKKRKRLGELAWSTVVKGLSSERKRHKA